MITKKNFPLPTNKSKSINPMITTPYQRNQLEYKCQMILSTLTQMKNASDFSSPVTIPAYAIRIPHPMDYSTVRTKLSSGQYIDITTEFARDIRRIFANCLRFQFEISEVYKDKTVRQSTAHFRGAAKNSLAKFESEWNKVFPTMAPVRIKCINK